ncbi:putative methyltransferase -like protein, partial [Trichinella nelsoni]
LLHRSLKHKPKKRINSFREPYAFNSTSNKFEVKIMRPENALAASMFYDDREARKYTSNSHMIQIQSEMAERALELLALPDDESSFLLDIGCGSGLAGEILTERDHIWVGLDISQPMLNIAKEREVEGTLILGDMGNGLPFRPGSFDGAISVSALQWLCYAEEKRQNPVKRLHRFFLSLYACLSRGSRAALQFYPDQPSQVELIMQQAMIAGFTGGVVVDYPESTRAKKIYLVLFTGGNSRLPAALTNECPQQNHVHYAKRRYTSIEFVVSQDSFKRNCTTQSKQKTTEKVKGMDYEEKSACKKTWKASYKRFKVYR